MSTPLRKDDLPTSFGAFKPVGHLMIGVPTAAQAQALTAALLAAGWAAADVLPFTPREEVAELEAGIENASGLAGFGYEITLMRRYLALARVGTQWLLVRAEESEDAARAADIARLHGATLAVHYRRLVIEELI